MTQQFREQPIPHGVGYQQTGRPGPRPASSDYGAAGMQPPAYRRAPSSYRAGGGGSGMSRSDEFLNSLTNAARENPLSAALVGIGVAWLFMGGNRTTLFGLGRGAVTGAAAAGATVGRAGYRAGAAGFEAGRSGIGYAGHAISSGAQGLAGVVSGAASRVGEAAGHAGEYVADAASSAYGRAAQAASGMMPQRGGGERTGGWDDDHIDAPDGDEGSRGFADMMPDMRGSMQNFGGNMQRMSGSVQQNLSKLFEKQPLALGAVGLAVGMALGAALPTTEVENQYLGEHSDALRDMAAEQFERAKGQASSALSDAQKYAEEQKLSTDGLREGAETVAGKVVNVAEAAVKGVKEQIDGNLSGKS